MNEEFHESMTTHETSTGLEWNEMDDGDLLQLAQHDHYEAIQVLLDRYQNEIYTRLLHILRDDSPEYEDAAEEISKESWGELVRSWSPTDKLDVRGRLLTIAEVRAFRYLMRDFDPQPPVDLDNQQSESH